MAASHWVQVIAPMDAVFVGPFDDDDAATAWARRMKMTRPTCDFYPMTDEMMRDNIAEFGDIPFNEPTPWEAA